jgi:hypothetical protein
MNIATQHLALRLPRRSIFSVPDAAGVEIACEDGSIWITLDNDPRDIVLEAGQSFINTDHRRATIYALENASVGLSEVSLSDAPATGVPVRRPVSRRPVFEQAFV